MASGKFNPLAARVQPDVVLVDLSPKTTKPKVVREGHEVPPARFDPKKVDFYVENLEVVAPRQAPRVISQSISAGTKVSPGTSVDLVLATASDIPFGILENPHLQLQERTFGFLIETVLENAPARQVLLKYESADDVPTAERQIVTQEFARQKITVTDDDSETGFERAFDSARAALAFR